MVAVLAMTVAKVCMSQRSPAGTLPVFECTPVTSRLPVLASINQTSRHPVLAQIMVVSDVCGIGIIYRK